MDLSYGVTRDEKKCIGCRACEVACSLRLNGEYDLTRSNVVGTQIEGETLFSVCRHCEKPECLLVCPVGAIVQDAGGIVRIQNETCVGCGICSTACAHGGIRFLPSKASKCDLCEGQPVCVSLCPQGALEYQGQTSLTQR
ncbi:MAG: 4Fe-4S dicluster domain-containing protein, partial [Deltaproteobacteria bacterium]